MTRRKTRRLERGIRPWKGGLQGYIKVRGVQYHKDYGPDEPLETIRAWRLKTQREHFGGGRRVERGTFAAAIVIFGQRIAAKPTATQMLAHMALWAAALGRDRSPHSITSTEIDIVLNAWLTTRPPPAPRGRPVGPDGLSDQTVLKRRSTLRSFFRVLNGKGGANPVRGAFSIAAAKPELRGTDYGTIATILAAMPTYRSVTRGAPKVLSLAPLRAAVIAYAGIPPGMLGDLQPGDVQLRTRPSTMRLERRLKAGGVEARTLPLSAEGRAALVAFDQAHAYGTFAASALNRSFQRAARRAGVTEHLTIYDLRHSFLGQLYLATRDTATVGRLGMHAPGSPVTSRYTAAAHAAVNVAAVARVQLGGRATGRKLSPKAVPARKGRRRRHLRSAS